MLLKVIQLGVGVEISKGVQKVQTSIYKCPGDVLYSMVTKANNTYYYIFESC